MWLGIQWFLIVILLMMPATAQTQSVFPKRKSAPATNSRTVTCFDLRGVRLTQIKAPVAGAATDDFPVFNRDRMTDFLLLLKFDSNGRDAQLIVKDKSNNSHAERSLLLLRIGGHGYQTFIAIDEQDNQSLLVTYLPGTQALILSAQATEIDSVGTGIIGKLFFADCLPAE